MMTMRSSNSKSIYISFLATLLLLSSMAALGLRSAPGQGNMVAKIGVKEGSSLMDMYATGSRLPDCSHACGPCFPCKRVMVSFKCSVAESCPIVYRCMCRGRYYHVPSN